MKRSARVINLEAEDIRIECDEDGFHLYIDADFVQAEGAHFHLPQDIAWKLADEVVPVIEWQREGRIAKAQYEGFSRAGLKLENGEWVAPDEGYSDDDPKRPGYHDRMVGDN